MAGSGAFKRRVVLVAPPEVTRDTFGGEVESDVRVEHKAWAMWQELSGTETVAELTEFGIVSVLVTFWWRPAFNDLNNNWGLLGEKVAGGARKEYDIESVVELGGRKNQIQLRARLRE